MNIKSIILGIAMVAVLLCVLVATRLMVLTTHTAEFELREIETVTLPEPPAPPPEEIPEELQPPPPPPALVDLRVSQDLSQAALPVADVKIDPRLKVDAFFADRPPAPLPVVERPKKLDSVRKPRVKPRPPRTKSQYSIGELDKKPRLISNPSVSFPRSIKNATRGRVVVRIAILPSGKSRYLSLVSSTHAALNPLARRIANGSRFTPPMRRGKRVKAIMTWPIIIKK